MNERLAVLSRIPLVRVYNYSQPSLGSKLFDLIQWDLVELASLSLTKLINCILVNLYTASPSTYFNLLFQVILLIYLIFILILLYPMKYLQGSSARTNSCIFKSFILACRACLLACLLEFLSSRTCVYISG